MYSCIVFGIFFFFFIVSWLDLFSNIFLKFVCDLDVLPGNFHVNSHALPTNVSERGFSFIVTGSHSAVVRIQES